MRVLERDRFQKVRPLLLAVARGFLVLTFATTIACAQEGPNMVRIEFSDANGAVEDVTLEIEKEYVFDLNYDNGKFVVAMLRTEFESWQPVRSDWSQSKAKKADEDPPPSKRILVNVSNGRMSEGNKMYNLFNTYAARPHNWQRKPDLHGLRHIFKERCGINTDGEKQCIPVSSYFATNEDTPVEDAAIARCGGSLTKHSGCSVSINWRDRPVTYVIRHGHLDKWADIGRGVRAFLDSKVVEGDIK